MIPQKKLLVVDDSKMTREIYRIMLEKCGYAVDAAEGGAQAIEKALVNQYDLVLTDINMPQMDGYEFIKRLRAIAEYRDTPTIVISTEREEVDKEKAFDAGADLYLAKPVEEECLVDNVRMAIERKKAV